MAKKTRTKEKAKTKEENPDSIPIMDSGKTGKSPANHVPNEAGSKEQGIKMNPSDIYIHEDKKEAKGLKAMLKGLFSSNKRNARTTIAAENGTAVKQEIIDKNSGSDKAGLKTEKGAVLDAALPKEVNRLHNLRKKKIFSHNKGKKFTTRGFVKIISLQENLEKAGFETDAKSITRTTLRVDLIICAIATLILLIKGFLQGGDLFNIIVLLAGFWVTIPFLLYALIWAVFLFYLDLKIYNRTKQVEEVFPDFLQLASANISAGMPIDRALWYAVRPNFGVLAKEIETVAKNTMAGQDLTDALRDFSKKYRSKVIQRSVSLILEGLAAGGELADLLSKIALNIEETRILKKDMAANVMTYVIFISFATIIAAPVLLGLSTQLLQIIQSITSKMGGSMTGSGSGFFKMSFSGSSIAVNNFKIFSYVMLTISSISAACIVNVIQKGTAKEGMSKIPIFILVSILLYLISSTIIGSLFAGMF